MSRAHIEKWLSRPAYQAVVLLLAAAAVFGQVAGFEFLSWDDNVYVSENGAVQGGLTWEGLRWAFTTKYFGLWHPQTWLSHMADTQVWGNWAGGHHLTSVFVHVGAAAFLIAFLREAGVAPLRAFMIGLLFCLHPLRAESVAWIGERKDVLCIFWLMVCLWAHGRWVRRGEWIYLAASVLACFLALLGKPLAVVMPALLLLADKWPLGRTVSWPRLILEKTGHALVAAVGLGMAFLYAPDPLSVFAPGSVREVTLIERVWLVMQSVWIHAFNHFWPLNLSFFHPVHWHTLPYGGMLGVVFLVGMVVLAVRQRHARPWVTFGVAWYLVALAPSSGLIQISHFAYADRYSYLPSIGLLCALVMSFPGFAVVPRQRAIQAGALAVLLLGLLSITAWQVSHWRNSLSVYQHALAVDADNHVAHLKLAELHFRLGRLGDAERHAQLADNAEEGSNFKVARLGILGRIALRRRDHETARAYWNEALALQPGAEFINLDMGTLALLEGDNEAAVRHLELARERMSSSPELWTNYGIALARLGRWRDAEQAYRRALGINPRNVDTLLNLAKLLENAGNPVEAQAIYAHVLTLAPGNHQARMGSARMAQHPR